MVKVVNSPHGSVSLQPAKKMNINVKMSKDAKENLSV